VHVALKQEGGTYDAPIKLPGAVSLSLEQQGELTPFYADGIKYYVAASNGGYQGDLEMALITDEFREKILGEEKDTNGVLIENSNAEAKEFALGLQIDGDTEPTLFWFYNCTATRPNVEAKTASDSKEPDVDKISISCAASADGTVRAKTTKESYTKVKDKWFTKVYLKDASLE
jgi:phi13 family phage major tail protein